MFNFFLCSFLLRSDRWIANISFSAKPFKIVHKYEQYEYVVKKVPYLFFTIANSKCDLHSTLCLVAFSIYISFFLNFHSIPFFSMFFFLNAAGEHCRLVWQWTPLCESAAPNTNRIARCKITNAWTEHGLPGHGIESIDILLPRNR